MACPNLDVGDRNRKHTRLWSRSTTASCSPTSNNSPGDPGRIKGFANQLTRTDELARHGKANAADQINNKGLAGAAQLSARQADSSRTKAFPNQVRANPRTKPVLRSKPSSPQRSIKNVRKPAKETKPNTRECRRNASIVTMKTPAVGGRPQPKPELFKSPGGTDYIVTPGRHVIVMNEFLASFDSDVSKNACPRMRGTCHYAESMYHKWLQSEKQIPPDVFMLSFADDSPMEKFRQMAVHSVFNYAVMNQLHQNTVHLSVLNISRLIHSKLVPMQETTLTQELFSSTVIAALRNAVKVDETYEKSDRFRIDPEHVWKASFFDRGCSVRRLNQIESECLSLLEKPADPPLAPEFLERYLAVGCWPENTDQYMELGSFLLGMSLFAHGSDNLLRGIPASKMAGAALVLAIKIINTDDKKGKWEFWPERLVRYTGYELEDLKPAIRGVAALLRKKPKQSAILERYYKKWGAFDWD